MTEELGKIKGIVPPVTPPDRTHIYHKYRIRLDREAWGYGDLDKLEFREIIREALNAEGVDAVLWQTFPLRANPLFLEKAGYGDGCPWDCDRARPIEYRVDAYPVTIKLCDNSFVICSEHYPIYAQPMKVMEQYVEAFHKVFNNLNKLF